MPAAVPEWHGLACCYYKPVFDVAAQCVLRKNEFLEGSTKGGVRAISQESEWNTNEC